MRIALTCNGFPANPLRGFTQEQVCAVLAHVITNQHRLGSQKNIPAESAQLHNDVATVAGRLLQGHLPQ
jgi:hypothetical protein